MQTDIFMQKEGPSAVVPLSATLNVHLLRMFGPSEEALTVFVCLIVAAINSMSGLSSQVVMLIKKKV